VLFLRQYSTVICAVLCCDQYFMDECRRGLERECGERAQELQGMGGPGAAPGAGGAPAPGEAGALHLHLGPGTQHPGTESYIVNST